MSSITALTRVSGALDAGEGWGAEDGACRGHRRSPDCPPPPHPTPPPQPADAQGLWTWTRWQMSGSGRRWRASSATSGRHPVSC